MLVFKQLYRMVLLQIVILTVLALSSQAAHYDGHGSATSHVTFNDEHNTVHHIHSVPTVLKSTHIQPNIHNGAAHSYAAPAHSYATPAHSYAASGHSYSAPVLSHHAPAHPAPVHGHAQSYSSFSVAAPTQHHSAPVGHHHIAPVAATPVFVKAAPAHHHHHEEEVYVSFLLIRSM